MEALDFEFPASILKNLADKNDDRRQTACRDIEIIIRKNAQKKNYAQLDKIISYFEKKYVQSVDASKRAAGLQIFRSVVNGVEGTFKADIINDTVIVICLSLLNDLQPKVRWASLQSLFHISKIIDQKIIKHFAKIFQKIIATICDADEGVKQAAIFLDKRLQTILNKTLSSLQNCKEFNLEQLMCIIKSKLKSPSSLVREFLIKWISNLNQLMALDLLVYLPDLLEDLLFMLGDKQMKLRQSAEDCLLNFERQMIQNFNEGKLQTILTEDIINRILDSLVKVARGKHPSYTKLNTLGWFKSLFSFFRAQAEKSGKLSQSKQYFKKIILERFDIILEPILMLMSHQEQQVRRMSIIVNQFLMQNIQIIKNQEVINFGKVMPLLKNILSQKKSNSTSESALKWMKFMLQNYNDKILPQINDIIQKLVQKLCDSNVKNVISIIQNTTVRQEYFELLIQKMLLLLLQKSTEPESSPESILKKFACILDPQKLVRSICIQVVRAYEQKKFICQIVNGLNILIINDKYMSKLRKKLTSGVSNSQQHTDLFLTLFSAFKFSPSATVSLCFFSRQYQLAYQVLSLFVHQCEPNVDTIMGFCKLIALFETPGFLTLRLDMLQQNNLYLMKALTVLLMLLPQGKLFNLLKSRIQVARIIPKQSQQYKKQIRKKFINIAQCKKQFFALW